MAAATPTPIPAKDASLDAGKTVVSNQGKAANIVSSVVEAPWIDAHALEDCKNLVEWWQSDLAALYASSPQDSRADFRARRVVSFIQRSNELERTSGSYSIDMLKILTDYVRKGEWPACLPCRRWDSEGENKTEANQQDEALSQAKAHIDSVCILYPNTGPVLDISQITTAKICEIHRTMFCGSLANGEEWLVGDFRKEPLHAGDYDFRHVCSSEEMEQLLQNLLISLKSALKSSQSGFVVAAWFTSRFLMLHPFANGNGRLARLLFAYICSFSYKIPLPAVLCSGTSKSRKNYMSALKKMQRGPPSRPAYMLAMALQSIFRTIDLARVFLGLADGEGGCSTLSAP